jgi:hypothetical protein
MPRIRNVKPDFFKDEDLAKLPFEARLFFQGLWIMADREGRLEYRPERLKIEIMPFDDVDVVSLCEKLYNPKFAHRPNKHFIEIYAVDGEQYIQVIGFSKHQRPHHQEPPSRIPCPHPDKTGQTPTQSGYNRINTEETANYLKNNESGFIGINRDKSAGILNLESGNGNGDGNGAPVFFENFNPDRITSDTTLPPVLQAEWDEFKKTYPKPHRGMDRAVRIFAKSSERARILRNTGHYSCSASAMAGFVMGMDKFVSGAFRDYDNGEKPLGQSAPPDRTWKEERERDAAAQREFEEKARLGLIAVRPRDRLPFEKEEDYERKRAAGILPLVRAG